MGIFNKLFGKNESKQTGDDQEQALPADVVKLPTDYNQELFSYGGDDAEKILMMSFDALNKGEKFFFVPRNIYDGAIAESKRYKEFEKRLKRTAELNNIGSAAEKEGRIDDAIKAYEDNIAIGYKATQSYDRLIVLYRRLERKEDLCRVIRRKIEVFGDSEELQVMLQKAEGSYEKPDDRFPAKAEPYKVDGVTLGEKFELAKSKMLEFDFYNSGDESRADKAFKSPAVKNVWAIQREFSKMLNDGKVAESKYDYETAARRYEELLAHQYQGTTAYERLIKIYSRAKLKDEEKRVLKYAILFFSGLRERQKDYVMALAKKYGKENFAADKIRNGEKITYYSGVYELYNPYPIIDKWQQRLGKLEK